MNKEYQSFAAFWPFYVSQHSKPLTRRLHFVGTFALFPLVFFAFSYNAWLLLLLPVVGYGFAWTAHFFVEDNRPATFTYPLWSLLSDFKMAWLMLLGKMDDEVERCAKLI